MQAFSLHAQSVNVDRLELLTFSDRNLKQYNVVCENALVAFKENLISNLHQL